MLAGQGLEGRRRKVEGGGVRDEGRGARGEGGETGCGGAVGAVAREGGEGGLGGIEERGAWLDELDVLNQIDCLRLNKLRTLNLC